MGGHRRGVWVWGAQAWKGCRGRGSLLDSHARLNACPSSLGTVRLRRGGQGGRGPGDRRQGWGQAASPHSRCGRPRLRRVACVILPTGASPAVSPLSGTTQQRGRGHLTLSRLHGTSHHLSPWQGLQHNKQRSPAAEEVHCDRGRRGKELSHTGPSSSPVLPCDPGRRRNPSARQRPCWLGGHRLLPRRVGGEEMGSYT